MSNITSLYTYVDQNRNTFIQRLIDYVRHPSISAYGEGMGEVADYLVKWLSEMKFNARLVPTKGWPMVLGKRSDQPNAPTVLLYGHYDVQPPDPLDKWVSPPFEPTIRDGRLYARGVGDNKGQHFAQLLAVESLLKLTNTLPCNIIVLLEGEEELGSPCIADFVRDYKNELNADLVIVSDGPVDVSGRSKLEFGVRGIVAFELHARGANQDLHSGNWGGVVPNPIWTLVQLLATMKNNNGQVTIDGFYDNVGIPSELEKQALAKLPIDIDTVKRDLDLKEFDQPIGRPFFDRLSLYPTFTINGFHGGYGGPGSKTVLPHEAFVKCDIRLVGNQTVEEIFGKVEAHIKKYSPQVKMTRLGGMDPSQTPIDSKYTDPIFKAITHAQGTEPLIVPAMGGSLPNYVFTKTLGLPMFVVPYANHDEANHAPNENMELDRFIMGIKTGAAMLTHLGEMKK